MTENNTPQTQEADKKAKEAFDAMTPREHRHAAVELTLCPGHGVLPFLAGQHTGGMTANKVENLVAARTLLLDAIDHINAAITTYTTPEE